ncbi:MAG: HAD family hydrolase [Deltaproteobacteria bacterium]|nr:HAD family hydrolase [Deltaproteobacteria bacterium]
MPQTRKMLPFDLVAFDLDGTLLDDRKDIPGSALGTIAALKARGVLVSIASGRAAYSCLEFGSRIGANAPLIAHNGSLVLSPDGSYLYHRAIPACTVARILALKPQGASAFFIQPDKVVHEEAPETHVRAISAWGHRIYERVESLARAAVADVTMLHMVGDRGALERVREDVGALPDVTAQIYPSERFPLTHLEVRAGDDTKGTGLDRVSTYTGVPRERIMAVGDWLNDLPMFEVAGISVAMKGAPGELLALADFVTDAHAADHGVNRFFARFLD